MQTREITQAVMAYGRITGKHRFLSSLASTLMNDRLNIPHAITFDLRVG